MIRALVTALEAHMKEQGFVLADSEDSLRDHRYTLKLSDLSSANASRGGLGSAVVRVDRLVEIRMQYTGEERSKQRMLAIAEDQETVLLAVYTMPVSGQYARFESATTETREGGMISILSFTFGGQVP